MKFIRACKLLFPFTVDTILSFPHTEVAIKVTRENQYMLVPVHVTETNFVSLCIFCESILETLFKIN